MTSSKKRRDTTITLACLSVFAGGVLLSLTTGATQNYDEQIFWLLRVPRTISAIAVGGGLGVAGTLVQAAFSNPLADPFTLGIASTAALGAVVGSLLKANTLLSSGVLAFLFAIAGLLLLYGWLRKSFKSPTEILLAGVVAGFFSTSLATLLMAIADPAAWSTAIAWMMGSLGRLSFGESSAALLTVLVICGLGWLHWKPLDLMAIDEQSAETAGVNVAKYRARLFLLVALLTAVCVSIAGVIGFVGLIVPHALRRLGLFGHFLLVPVSFVAGAGLLLCSDVVARVIIRPSEIPVGVIMAILGAPFFLILIKKSSGRLYASYSQES